MSQAQNNALALQDILTSIAESLDFAQQKLRNMPPYDKFGRPNTMYQLPYLDFSLQVTTEVEASSTIETQEGVMPAKRLMFKTAPVQVATSGSNSSRSEIISTISGRFVAVIPNDGIPQVILTAKHSEPVLNTTTGKYMLDIDALFHNVIGEVMPNSKIEFNFDLTTSQQMSAPKTFAPSDFPQLSHNEVFTDAEGKALIGVQIPKQAFENGLVYIFTVNCSTIVTSIAISK
jgi:hypothetical protein